jgi:hypothetical protein
VVVPSRYTRTFHGPRSKSVYWSARLQIFIARRTHSSRAAIQVCLLDCTSSDFSSSDCTPTPGMVKVDLLQQASASFLMRATTRFSSPPYDLSRLATPERARCSKHLLQPVCVCSTIAHFFIAGPDANFHTQHSDLVPAATGDFTSLASH